MIITRHQLRKIIKEASGVPSWPEQHFAWRNTVFTKDGDVRYINDVAEPETVQASAEMGVPVPPGANVLIVKGAYPNSESVWLHDAEVLDLIKGEGWYERPPPPDAKSGFWDGKGEWSEDPEEGLYDLPPEIDMPPAIPEGRRMRITRRQLRRVIKEAVDGPPPYVLERSGVGFDERFFVEVRWDDGRVIFGSLEQAQEYNDLSVAEDLVKMIDMKEGLYTRVRSTSFFEGV